MNTTTKVILGLTVAAAAGAAMGMLLAPEKGSDLQKRIKEGAQNWLDDFSALLSTGLAVVSELNAKTQQPKLEQTTPGLPETDTTKS
jgi:gas vesicle protein